jgi:hypothetical protein
MRGEVFANLPKSILASSNGYEIGDHVVDVNMKL